LAYSAGWFTVKVVRDTIDSRTDTLRGFMVRRAKHPGARPGLGATLDAWGQTYHLHGGDAGLLPYAAIRAERQREQLAEIGAKVHRIQVGQTRRRHLGATVRLAIAAVIVPELRPVLAARPPLALPAARPVTVETVLTQVLVPAAQAPAPATPAPGQARSLTGTVVPTLRALPAATPGWWRQDAQASVIETRVSS
jgi:hypothetical protein